MDAMALMQGKAAAMVRSRIERAAMPFDDIHCHLLHLIERQPDITQREAARHLGVSVGKLNYCMRALIARGYIKLGHFQRQPDKRVYRYMLTPAGIEQKARITLQFLQRKMAEYDRLAQEIRQLRAELERGGDGGMPSLPAGAAAATLAREHA